MVWMYSEMSCHSRKRNDGCIQAVLGNWGATKLKWLPLDSMAEDCRLTWLWQWIALFIAVFSSLELSWFSLSELPSMEVGPHNLSSETSFGGSNIHSVRIQLNLNWKIWEHRPRWVSAVHGWVGDAGHLAKLLSRISLGDSRSEASTAPLTEPELAEAISWFGSIGPNIALGHVRVKWGYKLAGIEHLWFSYAVVPPSYGQLTRSWQLKACQRRPSTYWSSIGS